MQQRRKDRKSLRRWKVQQKRRSLLRRKRQRQHLRLKRHRRFVVLDPLQITSAILIFIKSYISGSLHLAMLSVQCAYIIVHIFNPSGLGLICYMIAEQIVYVNKLMFRAGPWLPFAMVYDAQWFQHGHITHYYLTVNAHHMFY